MQVRCETWHEFVELYAGDIGQGGMFIVTSEPPPILSMIDIRMSLPEATEIQLRGRVVHVIDAEQAAADGKQGGAGIEFVDLDPERKRQIMQVVEFARWQGMSGDPTTSLARTMFELSTSIPPTKVLSTLNDSSSIPPAARNNARPQSSIRPSVKPAAMKITYDGQQQPDAFQTADGAARDPRNVTLDGAQRSVHPEDQGFSLRPGERRSDSKNLQPSMRPAPAQSLRPSAATQSGRPVGTPSGSPGASGGESGRPGAKAGDTARLKVAMAHFGHKRYGDALKVLRELLAEFPEDVQALRLQSLARARDALTKNDQKAAAGHYEKVLTLDENNREAREFVRSFHRDQRLSSLPFGRYFVKKK